MACDARMAPPASRIGDSRIEPSTTAATVAPWSPSTRVRSLNGTVSATGARSDKNRHQPSHVTHHVVTLVRCGRARPAPLGPPDLEFIFVELASGYLHGAASATDLPLSRCPEVQYPGVAALAGRAGVGDDVATSVWHEYQRCCPLRPRFPADGGE